MQAITKFKNLLLGTKFKVATRCMHCNANTSKEAYQVTKYPSDYGKWVKFCPRCKMGTFYGIS